MLRHPAAAFGQGIGDAGLLPAALADGAVPTTLTDEQMQLLARSIVDVLRGVPSSTPAPVPAETPPPPPAPTKAEKKKKTAVAAAGTKAPASVGGGVSEWKNLPPPNPADAQTCYTWMSSKGGEDPGECLALVYHHCVDGYKDESRVPPELMRNKTNLIRQLYEVQKGCKGYRDEKNKTGAYPCFPKGPPVTWSHVCVARPDMAGKGKCKHVKKDEFRVWIPADDPTRTSECQAAPSVYVKGHFSGKTMKVQGEYTGRHGHG